MRSGAELRAGFLLGRDLPQPAYRALGADALLRLLVELLLRRGGKGEGDQENGYEIAHDYLVEFGVRVAIQFSRTQKRIATLTPNSEQVMC
jgi:hypothetical protein